MFDENLITNKYLNPNEYLDSFKVDFLHAKPFPSIVIKEFFQEKFLSNVLEEFPDLEKIEDSQKYKNQNEFKFASNDYDNFPTDDNKNIRFCTLCDSQNSMKFKFCTSCGNKLIN